MKIRLVYYVLLQIHVDYEDYNFDQKYDKLQTLLPVVSWQDQFRDSLAKTFEKPEEVIQHVLTVLKRCPYPDLKEGSQYVVNWIESKCDPQGQPKVFLWYAAEFIRPEALLPEGMKLQP
jgi:hypothetical protein